MNLLTSTETLVHKPYSMDINQPKDEQQFYLKFSQAVWENDFRQLYEWESKVALSKDRLNSTDDKLYTPLHYVASAGDVKMCELFLEEGSAINTPDKNGNTALLWAVMKGHFIIVTSLIEKYHANLNIQNFSGESALTLATINNDFAMVAFLLENGASPNTCNLRRETALHIASALGYVKILEILIKYSAWLEVEDEVGETPLHFAVREGQIESIECLLSYGANPGHLNEDDESPLQLAHDLAERSVVRVFETFGRGSSTADFVRFHDPHFSHISMRLPIEISKMSLAN